LPKRVVIIWPAQPKLADEVSERRPAGKNGVIMPDADVKK
jgi:hypothetical protein